MREIKFRAWDKEEKEMVFLTSNAFSELLICFEKLQARYELMQYTGLKDKNGKEIYEGDILKPTVNRPGVWEVIFLEGRFALSPHNCYAKTPKPISLVKRIAIIGNIYENPELLEK